ncbi:hypothetical protein LUZ60_016122 [Juncus effusus]|nr:hypothetical protein LUZ60_016122 [Juncus effusus]
MGGSEDSVTYELSQTAYIKLVLHALKHQSSAVNGILVGRVASDGGTTVSISDAVPVSHTSLSLLPPLEIALTQAEEQFGKEGLNVVGYYHANERYDDSELGLTARKIGDHISRYFPSAPILLLDNKKLEDLIKKKSLTPVVQLYKKDSSKWRSDGSAKLVLKESSANVLLSDFIASQKWSEIVDFEDHLDDISKDWLNPNLFQ